MCCHVFLYVFWMIRNAVFANESATIIGDEYIVFDADSTKVLVGLNLIKIEEFCTVTLCLPVIDKSRDEVYTWLISYNESFL